MTDLVFDKKKTIGRKEILTNIEATKDRIKVLDEQIANPKFTSLLDSLLENKLQAQKKLADYVDQRDSFSESPEKIITPQEALREYRKTVKQVGGLEKIKTKWRSLLPLMVERIDVTPAKVRRKTICHGKVTLTSGKVRPFLFCDTDMEYQIFKTTNDKVLFVGCKDGIWGQYAMKNFPQPKISEESKEVLDEIDALFAGATYHGKSGWPGIYKHMFDMD